MEKNDPEKLESKVARLEEEIAQLSEQFEALIKRVLQVEERVGITMPGEDATSAAQMIATLRERSSSMTLKELGNLVGLSESQMSRVSRGVSEPRRSVVILLKKYLTKQKKDKAAHSPLSIIH